MHHCAPLYLTVGEGFLAFKRRCQSRFSIINRLCLFEIAQGHSFGAAELWLVFR